jgi:4-amino-4-deoxy-L-arabinose transferase-like glycosyltransferase
MVKDKNIWFLGVAIIAFVGFKWEALGLPFFWDEAWVYMPAIRTMAEVGPSVMPGSIDAELYTGHPLLFYFLTSSWIKLFGYSLFTAHLFPLLLSIGLLLSIYYVVLKWTQVSFTAMLAALLVLVQPIFLTQSTYMLIEVWLGLLFVWSFYFYFEKRWLAFGAVTLMALWSKESAYTLIPCFGILALIEFVVLKEGSKVFWIKIAWIMGAFLLGMGFFVLQKVNMGWYLFPRHTNWVNLQEFSYKFDLAIGILFKDQGRQAYYLLAGMAAIIGLIQYQNKLNKTQWLKVIGILLFSFGFMVFAAINFFSNRYLLGAIPLLMMATALLFGNIQVKFYEYTLLLLVGIYGSFNIYKSINNTHYGDTELSYTHLLKAQVGMVQYLEQNPSNAQLYAPFLMLVNLNNPYAGFVKHPVPNLTSQLNDSNNVYYLQAPNEYEAAFDSLLVQQKLVLAHEEKAGYAWVRLYKKP